LKSVPCFHPFSVLISIIDTGHTGKTDEGRSIAPGMAGMLIFAHLPATISTAYFIEAYSG